METTPDIDQRSRLCKLLSSVSVEPLLFCYSTAILGTFPTLHTLIFTKLCLFRIGGDNAKACDFLTNQTLSEVQNETSMWMLYTSLAYELIAMFTSLFWGTISDIYGRKFVLMISCTLATISAATNVWISINLKLAMGYIVISNIINGLGGGFNIVSALSTNYIHDVTSAKNRTKRILVITCAISLGATFGPIICGFLLKYISYSSIFLLITAIYSLCVLTGFLLLKDLTPNNSTEISAIKFRVITDFILTIKKKRNNNQRLHLILLLLAKSLFTFGYTGVISRVLMLCIRDHPLLLSASNATIFVGVSQFCTGVGAIIGGCVLSRVLGFKDETLTIIGLCSAASGFFVWGLAFYIWIMYIGMVFGILSYLGIGGIQSIMSKILGKDEQGKVFALSATLDYVTGALSPILFNFLYPFSRGFYNGLCYQVAAAILMGAAGCIIYIKCDRQKQKLVKDYTDDMERMPILKGNQ